MPGEFIADYILDLLVAEFDTATTTLWLCSQAPTTYAEASSTYALGSKAGLTIDAPSNRTPNGRKVTVNAITDGSVTADGTGSHWAITKNGTTLMATGPMNTAKSVTNGGTFTLDAFDIGVADAI
jgi:hypothetical protein